MGKRFGVCVRRGACRLLGARARRTAWSGIRSWRDRHSRLVSRVVSRVYVRIRVLACLRRFAISTARE